MGDYSKARATAKRLLTKFGKSIQADRVTGSNFDPLTGSETESSQQLNGIGVLLNFNQYEIDGQNILATDKKLIYSGDELKVGDKINGKRVQTVEPLNPDLSGAIIYTCGLRL